MRRCATLVAALALVGSSWGHNTHVCTMSTPGNSTDTCGKFVLWLGTYEHGNHFSTPGKAVVKLGQTIYPSSPFLFAGGSVTNYVQMTNRETLAGVRQKLSSAAFRAASPPAIRHAIVPGQTQVKCYSFQALGPGGLVTEITDPNAFAGCSYGQQGFMDQIPTWWYFLELAADSSADLFVSVDGVDATLSPIQGACAMSVTQNLGQNVMHGNTIKIPAEMLNVPSCGEPCVQELASWPNASSVTGCSAGTASGSICTINCATGFTRTGGSVRCINGNYVGTGQCSFGTSCPMNQALSVVPGLVGVTGEGCGEDTAEGAECLFNCQVGQFSVGTITCDAATHTWIASPNATCNQGTGSGVGDPDTQQPPPCLPNGTEAPSDFSAVVIPGSRMNYFRVNGNNFDPQADSIIVVPRGDCENPTCSQASVILGTPIACDSVQSTSTTLICGDGITTGLAYQDDEADFGKICFCDGSARGGCRSVGDFNTDGNVVGGLSGDGTEAPTTPSPTMPPTASPTTRHTCYASGDPHYQTFDGHVYDYQGQCEYVLVKDCRQNNSTNFPFQVQVRNSDRPEVPAYQVTWTESVAIQLTSGDVFNFASGNDNSFNRGPLPNLPYTDNDGSTVTVSNHLHPQYTVTIPMLGAKVFWDGRTTVRVVLDGTSPLRSASCGLCGDFDDNVDNDNAIVYLYEHWKVSNETTNDAPILSSLFADEAGNTCVPSENAARTRLCTGSARTAARSFCSQLLDTTYQACFDVVDPQVHYDNCVFDHCNASPEMACNSYRLYEDLCASMDVNSSHFNNSVVDPWSGSCYATAIPSSMPTMQPSAAPSMSPSSLPTSAPTMTPTTPMPTFLPTSAPSLAADLNFTCYGSGGSHYLTFDGQRYRWRGECQHRLVFCPVTGFEVQIRNPDRSSGTASSLSIRLGNSASDLTIELSRDADGHINDPYNFFQSLPFSDGRKGNSITMDSSTGKVTVSSSSAGVYVQYYRSGAVRIIATGNSTIRHSNVGLCGTFDGNVNDDLQHVARHGYWQASPQGPNIVDGNPLTSLFNSSQSCNQSLASGPDYICNPSQRLEAVVFCARLLDDLFAECQTEIDSQVVFEECVYDYCSSEDQACGSYAIYEDMCIDAGLFNHTDSILNVNGTCSADVITDGLNLPWIQPSGTCAPTMPRTTQTPTTTPTAVPSLKPTTMPSAAPSQPPSAATLSPSQLPATITNSPSLVPTARSDCSEALCPRNCSELQGCGWSTKQNSCIEGGRTTASELELNCATRGPSIAPTAGCSLYPCGAQCGSVEGCGWSSRHNLCVEGGRTTLSEMTLGICPPTSAPSPGCSNYLCGALCQAVPECGWSSNKSACVAGGRTSEAEMTMGVCPPTVAPSSGCSQYLCGAQCGEVQGCGWSSKRDECVAGGRTTLAEQTSGNCQ